MKNLTFLIIFSIFFYENSSFAVLFTSIKKLQHFTLAVVTDETKETKDAHRCIKLSGGIIFRAGSFDCDLVMPLFQSVPICFNTFYIINV